MDTEYEKKCHRLAVRVAAAMDEDQLVEHVINSLTDLMCHCEPCYDDYLSDFPEVED